MGRVLDWWYEDDFNIIVGFVIGYVVVLFFVFELVVMLLNCFSLESLILGNS